MRILVTGGTGFLGRHAALHLQSLGHDVAVLGRNLELGERLAARGLRFIPADLADREATNRACEGQEVVVHSAALAAPWGPYADFYRANVEGTRHLLAAALKHGIKRFVHISTPSVYFDYSHRLGIKETDPLPKKQHTHYAATKLLADAEVDAASRRGLPSILLRPRAIVGPEDQTVLGRILRLSEGGVMPLIGGGTSLVDMTYVGNVCAAIAAAITAPPTALGKVYNITNGEPMPVRAAMTMLFSALGRRVRFRSLPYRAVFTLASLSEGLHQVWRRDTEPRLTRYAVGLMAYSQTLDISAARRDLGYKPSVTLGQAFAEYAAWYRATGGLVS